ncbi:MAG: FAD-binding oxidoreductase [Labilithrix sp.]|nr:FAD-binding oxidoreductase [Labilithrix sp.]
MAERRETARERFLHSRDGVARSHATKLESVVRQLRGHAARAPGRPVSFKKKAVSHQVPKPHDLRHTDDKIDLSDLDAILEIDRHARTCTAEPGVTFTDLVDATLAHGLAPKVVPELATITIGGAVSGCSLESMSFRYGGFHDSCVAYEVVTASGDVLECTRDNEHKMIFEMMHGSFGTLGVLSKLVFELVPAKPFVKMRYEHHTSLEAYKEAIWRHFVAGDVDFMDGIIHSPTEWTLCLGTFVDEAPYKSRYDWVKVYYRTTRERDEDYLRTKDYFFRYDRGVTNPTPKSALGRLLFGKLASSAKVLRLAEKIHRWLPEKPEVTVDLFIPFSRVDAFMRWYRSAIDFFPLWCVPYRRVADYPWIAPGVLDGVDDPLFLDIAIYGLAQPASRNLYKELEEALVRVNGIKTLISYNYYDEEAFWTRWNRENYLAVKAKTDPRNVFRDLYAKTCLASHGVGG